MDYKKLNNISGWVVFAITFVVYYLTMAPTASFWDCGEFIACSNELEVPHPPGAPFFLLLGRLFAMLTSAPEKISFYVNMLSVLSSAFTVLFTFWITTTLAKKLVANEEENPELSRMIVILASGAVGALVCGFCDSFWFNAVEAEVYAMSSLFTAIVIWLIFKWEARADEAGNERWLVLIAYIMGLSIGVHLLNLLTIPALAAVYYFRKYKFSWQGLAMALGVGVVILGVIQAGIIVMTFDVAWWFEQFFVGTIHGRETTGLGLPMGTGLVFTILLLGGGLAYGIKYSIAQKNVILNIALMGVAVIYIGLSSYAMIPIRSAANPPIDENDPEGVHSFLSYMKREQYGDRPLFSGPQYNAQPRGIDKIGKEYTIEKGKDRYTEVGDKIRYEYAPEDNVFLPRMWERGRYNSGPHGYYQYVTDKGADTSPRSPGDDNPSGGDNMRFLFGYQINHMYLRYFLWNFVGRESDVQDCSYESGINYGAIKSLPEPMKNDPARNHYFAIPLILGLLGMGWQAYRRRTDAIIVGLLFFFTGLAIIFYLNQYPMQPRERDYSYVGSFQTFAIWVGLGVVALYEFLKAYLKDIAAYAATAIGLVAPAIMLSENFHDHSRAGNYVAPDSAYNLLNSLAKNAVLFTNGDNDTFPLWYLQEVEKIRPDVRVLCLSYVNTDWYINHMKLKMNDSPPLPITLAAKDYTGTDKQAQFFNTDKIPVTLPVDKEALLRSGVISQSELDKVESPMKWEIPTRKEGGGKMLQLADILIKNLVENVAKEGWQRPVYFANTVAPSSFVGLGRNLRQEGLAFRVVPVKGDNSRQDRYDPFDGTIRTDLMEQHLMKDFKYRGLKDKSVYYDENIRRMVGNYYNTFYRLASEYNSQADKLEGNGPRMQRTMMGPDNKPVLGPDGKPVIETIQPQEASEADKLKAQDLREKAKKVMKFTEENFPYQVVTPESYYLAKMGIMYDRLGMKDKSKEYFNFVKKQTIPILTYYDAHPNLYNAKEQEDALALQLVMDYLSNRPGADKKEAEEFMKDFKDNPSIMGKIMGNRGGGGDQGDE